VLALALLLAACGGGGGPGAGDDDDDDAPDGDGGPGDGDGGPGDDATALVFDPTVLHRVTIEVAEADVASLEGINDRVPCRFVFDGVELDDVGVRNKGQTSFRGPDDKLSFSLKFDSFVDGQRLHGLKKLVLSNTVQDPSFANEAITYAVYRRAGLAAPRVALAQVTFNGTVKGVYTIVEAVDRRFLERHFGEDDGDGNLYEGPWDFPQGAGAAELKDEVDEMRSRDDLEALTALVTDEEADLAADLPAKMDVAQVILGAAADVVTCAWDGYLYAAWNFYLYDRPSDGRFVMLPHGANWPYWHADLDPFDLYVYPWGEDTPPGYLIERIRNTPALDDQFHEAVATVAGEPFDPAALLAIVDDVAAAMAEADAREPGVAADLELFADGEDDLRDWIVAREAYLAAALD
jgi:spore coat protein CotH